MSASGGPRLAARLMTISLVVASMLLFLGPQVARDTPAPSPSFDLPRLSLQPGEALAGRQGIRSSPPGEAPPALRDRLVPPRALAHAPAQSAGFEIGRLRIPSIEVEEVIREGVAMSVLDLGVGHWVGTAGPGDSGNMVLAAHRTVLTRPFHDLDLLRPGDVVYVGASVTGEAEVARYRVTETFFVTPEEVWIADPTEQPTLTMFACHPKGSARQRIVVRAELVRAPSTASVQA
ncbi:MAG: class E sortase [Actinomycetota bacterium]|nr:class E sortase [Actinomycetota bacterium]